MKFEVTEEEFQMIMWAIDDEEESLTDIEDWEGSKQFRDLFLKLHSQSIEK